MNHLNVLATLLFLALSPILVCYRDLDDSGQESTMSIVTDAYRWEQVLPFGNGSFQQDWKPGTFPLGLTPIVAFGNNLWMVGQKAVWSSVDGIHWSQHPKKDWGERISMSYVYFKGKLWMMGGMKYGERQLVNDLWSSLDGTSWEPVGQGQWPARKGHTLVVFRDKLWLLGGAADVQPDFTSRKLFNDVWSSADGIHWQEEIKAAPWSTRDSPHVMVFQDALYLVGGQGMADVWRSVDGKNWKQLTSQAAWKKRFDQGVQVFDEKLWVFGGRDTTANHQMAAKNDVWYSIDGLHWTMHAEHAPWTVRSGGTCVVFKDKLWLYSGKHTGGQHNWGGDVWTMKAFQK